MGETDAKAILASRTDAEAFASVVRRRHASVHRYLQRRVGADLAEDLAAEVFVAAFAQRARYDPTQADAGPWLLGIATNLLRRHRRTEVRRLRAFARSGRDPAFPSEEDRSHARVDAGGSGPALAGALASLPRRHRDALLLHAIAELPVDDVARAMNVPLGTAKTWLARARKAARAHLEAHAATPPRSTAPQGGTT